MQIHLFAAGGTTRAACGSHVSISHRMTKRQAMARAETPMRAALMNVRVNTVTATLLVAAAGLFRAARSPNPSLELALAAILAGGALTILHANLTVAGRVMALPQWTLFLALAGVIGWGRP